MIGVTLSEYRVILTGYTIGANYCILNITIVCGNILYERTQAFRPNNKETRWYFYSTIPILYFSVQN